MRITFVLPGWARFPVGGFKMVYSYASRLAEKGHKVCIVHTLQLHRKNMNLWKKSIRVVFRSKTFLSRRVEPRWFKFPPEIESKVVLDLSSSNIPAADAVIATAWSTAESVNKLSPDKGAKFYFIQGYENWGTGDEKVNASFKLPLKKIVVSTWLEKRLESKGEKAIARIPNGLDFEVFRITKPVDNRFPARIGMCYSIYEWKGSKDGIKALKIARERFPQLQSIFFSVCPRHSEIPSWVEYRRNPSPSQLIDIYNSCSIFISPSWAEGWGLPAAEAMACGCAVVSTDCGGIREYAEHEINALLSPPEDPQALARSIIRLLEDDDLRLRLARAGYKKIQEFTWEKAVEKLEVTLAEG